MKFFIRDQSDEKSVEINIMQSGQSSVLITGTTSNYLDQGLLKLRNGRIERFVLPNDFIKQSGIEVCSSNKIKIEI